MEPEAVSAAGADFELCRLEGGVAVDGQFVACFNDEGMCQGILCISDGDIKGCWIAAAGLYLVGEGVAVSGLEVNGRSEEPGVCQFVDGSNVATMVVEKPLGRFKSVLYVPFLKAGL